VNINRDPRFLDQRRQLREQTIATTQQTKTLLKELATKVKDKTGWAFWGSDQEKFANEINAALEGKFIRTKDEYGRPITIKNPFVEVDVSLGGNRITLKDSEGDTSITMAADEFAALVEGNNLIVTESGLSKSKQQEAEPEPIPEPGEALPLDTLGMKP
jgi:hypothetical protein